jgi:hypothetical protein
VLSGAQPDRLAGRILYANPAINRLHA